MRFKLTSADNLQTYDLKTGSPMVVGRAPTSDIPVFDPTISRRHAELMVDDKGVQVRDLQSSNGTFLNGARVETCMLAIGDTVTFGKVPFKLLPLQASAAAAAKDAPSGATIVKQIAMKHTPGSPFTAIKSSEQAAVTTHEEMIQQKLSTLLEVSKQLGMGAAGTDAILQKIVEKAYEI